MQLENTDNLDTVLDRPNLKIIIEGLALSHFVDGQWKVFFPKVAEHEFKLIVKKKNGNTTVGTGVFALPNNFGREGSKITLTPDNTGTPGTANEQVKDALDISDLHSETIYLTPDKTKYAGFLTLNGAMLFSEGNSPDTKFEIWDTRPTEQPPRKIWVREDILKNSFSSGFEIGLDQTTSIQVENELGFNLSLEYDNNTNYEVIFFNDCENESCENISDFKHYYDIIDENQLATKRRFELILISGGGGKGRNGSCGGRTAQNLSIPGGF